MERVEVKKELLEWACARNGLGLEDLTGKFAWLGAEGTPRPTLKQLEKFANATRTPVGYLFLPAPPEERVPIPDLRTMGSRELTRPSPDLLDTIHHCEQRQEWYRGHAQAMGQEARTFIGSAKLTDNVVEVAVTIRTALHFDLDSRRRMATWAEALRSFVEQADALGVLVMISGIVGSNTHRKLDPMEFRGFALSDPWAPVVFINGRDSKSAQMFTLAHELAHLWLGESALSNAGPITAVAGDVERFCNQVAAELLVPLGAFAQAYDRSAAPDSESQRLARHFKVSTLVILRRMHDAGGLSRDALRAAYDAELERLAPKTESSGGDFYNTQPVRVGKRFARALIESTLEGQTLHRDAFRMLGISKVSTLHNLGARLGVAI